MIATGTNNLTAPLRQDQGEWVGSQLPARPREQGGSALRFLVTGLVIAGLGLWAWNYFGPDLRRYLKIKSM